jgi:hypothetical protein
VPTQADSHRPDPPVALRMAYQQLNHCIGVSVVPAYWLRNLRVRSRQHLKQGRCTCRHSTAQHLVFVALVGILGVVLEDVPGGLELVVDLGAHRNVALAGQQPAQPLDRPRHLATVDGVERAQLAAQVFCTLLWQPAQAAAQHTW